MAHYSSDAPESDDLAIARADLCDLLHCLPIIEQQQAFLLRAIDAKVIEIHRLERPEMRETLERIVGKGRG